MPLISKSKFKTIAEYISVGLTTCLLVFLHFRLWTENFSVPYNRGGDSDFHPIMVRTIQKTGWIFENPQLGAPKTSKIFDVPQGGDNLQWLVMKLLSYVFTVGETINVYFLLTYFFVSICAYSAAKWYGLTRISSLVIAILYAFLPYHLYRGEGHLLLSMYCVIPLVIVYAYKSCTNDYKLSKWKIFFFAIIISSLGAYYAIFSIMIISFSLLFSIFNKKYPVMKNQLWLVFASALVFLFNQAPTIIYRLANGENPSAAARQIADAENFGLQITNMFGPRLDHRIHKLAEFALNIQNTGTISELGQPIGIVATIGTIALLIMGFINLIKSKPIASDIKFFFLLVPAIMLFAVSSGPTLFLASLGFTEIRSWNRVVVIIAFIGLLIVGRSFDYFLTKYKTKEVIVYGLIGLTLIVGFLDQTSPKDKFNNDYSLKAQDSDCSYVKALESKNLDQQNVFQLPFLFYPEGPNKHNMNHYDQAMSILCDTNLKFSFGAMVGRDDQFQSQYELKRAITSSDIEELRKNNFSVIDVYRSGYQDDGEEIEANLKAMFGDPILSPDKTRAAYFIDK